MLEFVDCHAHIFAEKTLPYEEQNEKWRQANVSKIIQTFCLETDLQVAIEKLETIEKYPDLAFIAGVSPHGADKYGDACEHFLRSYNDHLVAVGEIGLDFFYELSPRDIQREVFIKQLKLAGKLNKPVVLHLRSADKEAQEILDEYKEKIPGVMMHCYTSGPELAEWAIEQKFYMSASGIITFKKSQNIRDIFKKVPLDLLLVETDSPYLAPMPYRGKTNHPALILETYRFLADMYEVPLEQLAKQVRKNSRRLFGESI